MHTLSFVVENRRFLTFGLLLTAFSSFGQTFYIALFGGEIRADFGLSHGDFGRVYALATLASGSCLIWLGRRLDDVDLRVYSVLVCAGLVGACLFMAVAESVLLLGAAIFTLRLFGQGLMSHTAITSMARYFADRRGMAVSIASLGHAAGEAVFPLMAVALMAAVGWREAWAVVGVALAAVLVPLVLWVLRGHGERHRRHLERLAGDDRGAAPRPRQWSRREVLRDPRFYLMLPAVLAPSFIMTGLFFHQVHLVESKGWSLALFASGFMVYAGATITATLIGGALVDRVGAARLMRFHLAPLAAALAVLAALDHPAVAFAFMLLGGISSGVQFTVVGAVWAEVYGVAHLGAIKALTTALMVFSTALAPAVMGGMIDAGVSMEAIAAMCLVYTLAGASLVGVAFRRRPGKAAPPRRSTTP